MTLKATLELWFGKRFHYINRDGNIRIKMTNSQPIPVTLQKIFAPNRKVSTTKKSIQKSTNDWKRLIAKMSTGEGQKATKNWLSKIGGNDFSFVVNDIHFSHLAKEVSNDVTYIEDYDLTDSSPPKLTLKYRIDRKDGGIDYERAESLMSYSGTPEHHKTVLQELSQIQGKNAGKAPKITPEQKPKRGSVDNFIQQAKQALGKKN